MVPWAFPDGSKRRKHIKKKRKKVTTHDVVEYDSMRSILFDLSLV